MDLLLIIIPIILIALSQAYINSAYKKYQNVPVSSKLSGMEVARKILDKHGLNDVKIAKVNGTLTDNFNPTTRVVSLSEDIYEGRSIASVAVAAHECGHVIQHKERYFFIVLRGYLVPVVNLTSKLGYVVMIIGVIASIFDVAMLGLILMCASLVFQLVTLPTEFDASNRGKKELLSLGVINDRELPKVREMLTSAALTYVASFFASLAQMLRLFLSMRRND